ncbi:MAG: hypothetical protein NTW04_06100, partial [Elusimicrobia bacterium]|nr:hypothetical protein [Elusimicrobiota bacterium]
VKMKTWLNDNLYVQSFLEGHEEFYKSIKIIEKYAGQPTEEYSYYCNLIQEKVKEELEKRKLSPKFEVNLIDYEGIRHKYPWKILDMIPLATDEALENLLRIDVEEATSYYEQISLKLIKMQNDYLAEHPNALLTHDNDLIN